MKKTAILKTLIFLFCFPGLGFAKNELVMEKELFWAQMNEADVACNELIYIEVGRDVSDMRNEQCGFTEGKYSITLSGPPGTTVTFFGKNGFKKGNGFLTIRKTDDRMLWVWDLTAFPSGQWHTTEANDKSGAFEAYYNSSPMFEKSVSSVQWGDHTQ